MSEKIYVDFDSMTSMEERVRLVELALRNAGYVKTQTINLTDPVCKQYVYVKPGRGGNSKAFSFRDRSIAMQTESDFNETLRHMQEVMNG